MVTLTVRVVASITAITVPTPSIPALKTVTVRVSPTAIPVVEPTVIAR